MRLRHKPWAMPSLEANPYCHFRAETEDLRGRWREVFQAGARAVANDAEEASVMDVADVADEANTPDTLDAPRFLHVDLGAGRGRFTLELAKRHPEIDVLGIEISADAIERGGSQLQELALPNARYLIADLEHVQDYFAPGEVDEFSINFCNPWPKRRHQKRRLTHPTKLRQYHPLLKTQGRIYFKTDDEGLYLDSLAYFPACGFEIVKTTDNLSPNEDRYGIITEYEERWRQEGIKIKYIEATKSPF